MLWGIGGGEDFSVCCVGYSDCCLFDFVGVGVNQYCVICFNLGEFMQFVLGGGVCGGYCSGLCVIQVWWQCCGQLSVICDECVLVVVR